MATRSLWRHRDFLLLWGGQTVSEMGSAITQLALPLTAVVLLGASTLQVGLLTAAATAAFALIALPAGALVDRHAKRRLMIWCDAARLVIIGSVPVAAGLGVLTLAQLYVVAATAGVCTVFFDVAYQSLLPVLVDKQDLVDGNGKLGATQSFAQVTGPGIGGGLVGLVGAAGAMTADAISYGVSVVSLLAIRAREPAPQDHEDHEDHQDHQDHRDHHRHRPGLRAEIAEGLSFVLRHPILRKIVAATGTANLFLTMAIALEIVFLVRVLHVRPAGTGLLVAAGSLGGVAGGVLSGRLARAIGSARIIWFSLLVLSLPSFLAPLAEPGWRVAAFPVGLAASTFSGVVYNVAQVSYRQAICPPRLLGRMNAAVRWVVWGTIPLGGILGGVFGTVLGVRPTLWLGFAGCWAAGFWVFFSPLRRLRDVPQEGPQAAPQEGPQEAPREAPQSATAEELEVDGAPGGGLPGQGGGELPDGTGAPLGH